MSNQVNFGQPVEPDERYSLSRVDSDSKVETGGKPSRVASETDDSKVEVTVVHMPTPLKKHEDDKKK